MSKFLAFPQKAPSKAFDTVPNNLCLCKMINQEFDTSTDVNKKPDQWPNKNLTLLLSNYRVLCLDFNCREACLFWGYFKEVLDIFDFSRAVW